MTTRDFIEKYIYLDEKTGSYKLYNIAIINAEIGKETRMLKYLIEQDTTSLYAGRSSDDMYRSYVIPSKNQIHIRGESLATKSEIALLSTNLSTKDVYFYPEIERHIERVYEMKKDNSLVLKSDENEIKNLYATLGMKEIK